MKHQGDICLYLSISDGACVTVSTLCWYDSRRSGVRTYAKDPLSSARVEHGVTPAMVSITALTGLLVHPAWLQGHVAAPLCPESQRHFRLLTQAPHTTPEAVVHLEQYYRLPDEACTPWVRWMNHFPYNMSLTYRLAANMVCISLVEI